jgi:acetyltransferase-like isoleucine patch superfamily enzyme
VCTVIAAKWLLLGRTQAGNYDWDKSSYWQRWQILLAMERLRRRCFRGYGILGMLSGTWYCAQYFRFLGASIGKDCAIFAGGPPGLVFTEPDLLRLGERVVVDDASLVCHVDTEGRFDLNRLGVGDRCVLRTGSRLLSGVRMQEDSCLLEHSLVMGGDVVDKGETMQGWPGDVFRGRRMATENG